ncbi:FmdB family zinc ribbon protein [Comamonas endophytica]|uniref:Zinc ribbon domain-containing protein n=1 Tax=Comamonas endophytica TaxID=2949090 RepID=A0ABY6GC27_9BURK|nr:MULTISPECIES: FmdB family zinc ribbon protein [unclassified Acidovorax]MCD2513041.1 zinc ribbon domain-containing protein [Acidovorax sp. D4N7]UYG52619.1 zinc ribbon domain-containing protein [Acidovorax sp. 5MLIR]
MPIYAYKCGSCGHAKDVLQKMSDAALTQCPACNAQAFSKQLTAPGFQLKGTGWYATDFKNGSKAAAPAVAGASSDTVATPAAAAPAAPAPAAPAASAGAAA